MQEKGYYKEALWTKNFIVLLMINLLIFFSFQLYSPSLPPYLKSLGVDESVLGWYTALSMFAALLVRPFVGALLDCYGRKHLFLAGLCMVFSICTMMYFFPFALALLFLRLMQGVGWGIISTSAATIVADNIPRKRFGEGIGFFSLSSSLALATAPAIALTLPIDVLFCLAAFFMFITIMLALVLKYNRVSELAECSNLRFTVEKSALLPTLIIFFVNICYGAVVTFLVIYAQSRGIENISSYYLVYAATLMVTRPNIGKLVDKKLYVQVMVLGIFCMMLAFSMISMADSIYLLDIGAFFYGIGQGAVLTTSQTLSVINAPEHKIGMASATFAMGFDIGIAAGAVFSGLLVNALGYSGMFFSLILAPLAAGAVFMAAYKRRLFGHEVHGSHA